MKNAAGQRQQIKLLDFTLRVLFSEGHEWCKLIAYNLQLVNTANEVN